MEILALQDGSADYKHKVSQVVLQGEYNAKDSADGT